MDKVTYSDRQKFPIILSDLVYGLCLNMLRILTKTIYFVVLVQRGGNAKIIKLLPINSLDSVAAVADDF